MFKLQTLSNLDRYMIEEYEKQRRKEVSRMRSVVDYVMGVFFILAGCYFLLYESLDMNIFSRDPSSIDYLIAILFIAYGSWRIYRGYRKNYFRD